MLFPYQCTCDTSSLIHSLSLFLSFSLFPFRSHFLLPTFFLGTKIHHVNSKELPSRFSASLLVHWRRNELFLFVSGDLQICYFCCLFIANHSLFARSNSKKCYCAMLQPPPKQLQEGGYYWGMHQMINIHWWRCLQSMAAYLLNYKWMKKLVWIILESHFRVLARLVLGPFLGQKKVQKLSSILRQDSFLLWASCTMTTFCHWKSFATPLSVNH